MLSSGIVGASNQKQSVINARTITGLNYWKSYELSSEVREWHTVSNVKFSNDHNRLFIAINAKYQLAGLFYVWNINEDSEINLWETEHHFGQLYFFDNEERFFSGGLIYATQTGQTTNSAFSVVSPDMMVGMIERIEYDSLLKDYISLIEIIDLEEEKIVLEFSLNTGPISHRRFSHNGEFFVLVWQHEHIIIYDIENQNEIRIQADFMLLDIAFSSTDDLLASTGSSGAVHIWDIVTGELVHELQGESWINHVVEFSPDGDIVLAGDINGTLHIWNTHTGEKLMALDTNVLSQTAILNLEFSHDGTILAISKDGEISLWRID